MKESLTRMLGAVSTLLLIGLFVFAAAPARADGVGDRITALEEELSQLKGEQTQMREDALAAKAKLPTFKYRPRKGIWITAGDKSWAWNTNARFYMNMYNHTDGQDADGFSVGDLHFRRTRIDFRYCWDNCLYQLRIGIDGDTGSATSLDIQNSELRINLNKLNPNYPTIWISDKGGQSFAYVENSSSSTGQVELASDLMSDSDADQLSHRGIGIGWLSIKVGEGDYLVALTYKPGSGINKDDISTTDHKQIMFKTGFKPFKKSKNKWLKKLRFGYSIQGDSVDDDGRHALQGDRIRLRTLERVGRLTVFSANNIGQGTHTNQVFGAEWGVGPYLVRVNGGTSHYEGKSKATDAVPENYKGVSGKFWNVAHQLALWSPKGIFTGGAQKAGTFLLGFAFMRGDAKCGVMGCDAEGGGARNHLTLREVDLWYWVRPGLRVGIWGYFWDAANFPVADQVGIGCSSNNNTRTGKSCSWQTVNLGLHFDW